MTELQKILSGNIFTTYNGKIKSNVLIEMFEKGTFTFHTIILNISLIATLIMLMLYLTIGMDKVFFIVPGIFLLCGFIIYGFTYYFEKITIGVLDVIMDSTERENAGIENAPIYSIYVRKGFKIFYLKIPKSDTHWNYNNMVCDYVNDLSKLSSDNITDYTTTDRELVINTIEWFGEFYNLKNKKLILKLKWLKEI